MKKWVILSVCIVAAAVLFFLSYQFCSQRSAVKTGKGLGHLGLPSISLPEALDLTSEQGKKINLLDENFSKELVALRSEITLERMSLCELMHQSTWDKEKIEKKMKAICALQGKQQKRMIEHLARIKAVLTPGQQKELTGLICQELCEGYQKECGKTGKGCLCGKQSHIKE